MNRKESSFFAKQSQLSRSFLASADSDESPRVIGNYHSLRERRREGVLINQRERRGVLITRCRFLECRREAGRMTTACSCLPDQISCVLKVPTTVRHQYRLKSEKSNRRKSKLTSIDVVGRSSGVRGVLGEKEDTGSGLLVDLEK